MWLESADKTAVEERFIERPGARLYCRHQAPRGPCRGMVALMHGYGEHCGRYEELSAFFVASGYRVAAMDARGHGRSSGQRGYVSRFDDYVEDYAELVAELTAAHPELPLVALGHSNGGLIAARAVQRGSIAPRALILSSPLLWLRSNRRPVPDFVARALSAAVPRLPLPRGGGPEDLTHDPGLREALARDRLAHRVATPRWYWSAVCAGRQASSQASEVTLPLLVVVGADDPLVDPAGGQQFYERSGSAHKQLWTRRGELHEVLNELERRRLFERIVQWLPGALAASAAAAPPAAAGD